MNLFFRHLARDMESVYRSDVVINHTQILDLPSTAVTLIPAPGDDKVIVPLFIAYRIDTLAGAYGNVQPASGTQIGYSAVGSGLNTSLHLFTVLGAAQETWVNEMPTSTFAALASAENQALVYSIDNAGSGPFTDGNAANALYFMIDYAVVYIR